MEKNKPPLTPEEEKAKEERAKKERRNEIILTAIIHTLLLPVLLVIAILSWHSDGLGDNTGMEGERVEIPE